MPTEILKLKFPDKVSQTSVIRELLPTIEHYRSQQKSLKAIHQALFEMGALTALFPSFKTLYYSQRDNWDCHKSVDSSDLLSQPTEAVASSVEEVGAQRLSKKAVPSSIKIRIEDEDLEVALAKQQAQAEIYFNR